MPSVGIRRTTRVFGVATNGNTDSVLRSGRRLPESVNVEVTNDDSDNDTDDDEDDRFYGIKFIRKRKRIVENEDRKRMKVKDQCVLAAIVKPCSEDSGLFSRFLFVVLSSVAKFGLTIEDFSSFVLSEPICSAYASSGIQFFQDSVTANIGVCRFFGVKQFMPLFCVDFSAIPLCFKYLHTAVLLRYMFKSFFLECNLVNVPIDVEENIDLSGFQIELPIQCDSYMGKAYESGTISITPEVIEIDDCLSLHVSVECSRLAGQNGQCQNLNSKHIQTRRTSLRIREAQNPSMENRSNSALPYDSKGGWEKSRTGVASDKKLKINSCAAVILSEAKSVLEGSKEAIDSSYCSANILIVESDRCYRVEGAVVTSEERPDLREWHLAVKKDGLTRCTLKADKVMRPCSTNRYTHVRMVSLINGWKLEFSKHQDWIAFKNLYKECAEREIPIPAARFIPVPGVCEVSNYADSCTVSFNRPDFYISTNHNEFYRAMRRKTANYDMDSEDEEWVSNFNNKFQEHVSLDDFESTVDALEKTYYCSPDDCYDEKSVTYWCLNVVSKKVVEAVHRYWMRKRKRKHSSLLKIFQNYQSEICPFVPKPLLRKKRSFKRHPSQRSRSNLPVVSQGERNAFDEDFTAVTGEQDPLDEDVMLKILRALAAKAAAVQKMELAIQKRKEAQSLAEKADLAIYKATMSVRISETTEAGGSTEVSVQHFLE
ncbi:uncharacterized protein LOC123920368 isoform X2 [Trifolium pratense]|uniref:Uncharacterized protein n=1 Tax=Trifolium pratense TaxID=57577 RepID=A0ACB0IBT3_TRIPR|nr:uncharacterized protein LOC123920368 isoform X2 [Trifolium pratense]XP_045828611.1 uncharacterized protein LOC123920368 isoform X2 [Trifolium pratense]CAJ2629469.1 unnamed protein product [Trifolium pratense]